jgi:hypothetical protein
LVLEEAQVSLEAERLARDERPGTPTRAGCQAGDQLLVQLRLQLQIADP